MSNSMEGHQPDCESCYNAPPDPFSNVNSAISSSLYFNDGERSIDFVLVWKADDDNVKEELRYSKRLIYEENLMNEGLDIEQETYENLNFVKVC